MRISDGLLRPGAVTPERVPWVFRPWQPDPMPVDRAPGTWTPPRDRADTVDRHQVHVSRRPPIDASQRPDPAAGAGHRSARLAVAYTFAAVGTLTGAWAPRIPQVEHALGLSPGALGIALLAPAAGAMVAMPLAGAGAARWGSRPMTRGALVACCPLAAAVGLAGALWSLWLALFCWGITLGSLDVAMNAQGVSVEKAYGRPVLSGFHAAFSVGALAGAGVGSVAAALDLPVGWQQFVLGLALLVVGGPVTRAFVPDPVGSGVATGPVFAVPSGRLLLLGLAAFACLLCEGAASDWSAVQLRDSLGAPAGVAGAAFVAFSVAMTAGRLVGDRITARLGRVATVRSLTVLGTVGLAVGLGSGTVAGAVAGFGLLGVGLSCVIPVLFGAAGHGPGAAGPAIAAVATCGYLGWMLGPAIIGGLAQAVGLSGALWLLPVLTVMTGILAFTAAPVPSAGGVADLPGGSGGPAGPAGRSRPDGLGDAGTGQQV